MWRLNPAELETLRRGDQERWNRMALALAWMASLVRPLVAAGVADAIRPLIAGLGSDPGSPHEPITFDRLLASVPGYRKDED